MKMRIAIYSVIILQLGWYFGLISTFQKLYRDEIKVGHHSRLFAASEGKAKSLLTLLRQKTPPKTIQKQIESPKIDSKEEMVRPTPIITDLLSGAIKKRRERYPGKYPKKFEHRYKELNQNQTIIEQVIRKGKTPAGQHLPIMVNEILQIAKFPSYNPSSKLLICDATLGYGGHFQRMIENLELTSLPYQIIGIDQDYSELQKTKIRIRDFYQTFISNIANATGVTRNPDDEFQKKFFFYNANFEEIEGILQREFPNQRLSLLLADLGFSSMQVDDPRRGFSYKALGPLDMRMNHSSLMLPTAYDVLKNLTITKLIKILKENSDEVYAVQLAKGILNKSLTLPNTTVALYQRIQDVLTNNCGLKKKEVTKQLTDSVAARVMQALRIEVNREFEVLEQLLSSLPRILDNSGKAIFLTFHSGEDRRVKKEMKDGAKNGIYSEYNRNIIRASPVEQNRNSRSKCCKLRYCVKSTQES